MSSVDSNPSSLLEVKDLHVYFPIRGGVMRRQLHTVKAVSGVSLNLAQGEVLGLVGESGCGKTTLGRALVGLAPMTSGRVFFNAKELHHKNGKSSNHAMKMQLIFQDPYSSLHPRKQVRDLVCEGLLINGLARVEELDEKVLDILEKVGLGVDHLYRYPHEFSGGQRQRISLARALILKPELIILDEPTSALDVSVQAQILNMLKGLQKEYNLTYLFISHDLSVVRYMSRRIGVMYLGNLVEIGPTRSVFENPKHPYTHSLLSALPSIKKGKRKERMILKGDPPTPIDPPPGCPFADRCSNTQEKCRIEKPVLEPLKKESSQLVACFFQNENVL